MSSLFGRKSLEGLEFAGFVTFERLLETWLSAVPKGGGVYAVLRELDAAPTFLERNPGGRFKGRDPTASIAVLQSKWVESCDVIYLGKGDNLQRRLKEYADFGRGKPVGHWGGRYIWQLADSADLTVAWKKCETGQSARELEAELLVSFQEEYGCLPFANLRA